MKVKIKMRPFRKATSRFLISIFILILIKTAPAQSPHLINYTTDDGLPDLIVYQAMQDRQGYLWFATDNGVCRFNGYEFQRFPGPAHINFASVFDLQEDDEGRIWFNTLRGNLYYVENDTIHPYWNNHVTENYQDRFATGANFYIKNNGETVFIELAKLGILEINREGEGILHQAPDPTGLMAMRLAPNKILCRGNSSLDEKATHAARKLLKENGIQGPLSFQLEDTVLVVENLPAKKPGKTVRTAFLETSPGSFLFSHQYHLTHIKNKKVSWTVPCPDEVFELIPAKDGSIHACILSGKGIRKYANLEALRHNEYTTTLDGTTVTWMCEDADGGTWYTTFGQGVFYAPDPDFLIYDQRSGLSDDLVRSISIGNENSLFFGLQNGDVYQLDMSEGVPELIVPRQPSDFLYHLYFDSLRQKLWVGNRASFFMVDPKSKETYLPPEYTPGKRYSMTRYFTPSPNQETLWGFAYIGIGSFDLNTQRTIFSSLELNYKERVYGIIEDHHGRVWLGTRHGLKEWRDSTAQSPPEVPPELRGYVTCLAQLPDSTLVAGTRGSGLVFWKNNDLEVLTSADGLTFDAIEKLHIEDENTVWAVTGQGLNRIRRQPDGAWEIKQFTVADGLPSNVVWDVKTTPRYIWVGTNKGLVRMPRNDAVATSPPPSLTALEVNGEVLPLASGATFSHRQNNLTFRFNILKFNQLGSVSYRFRLFPASQKWNETEALRADYPTLPPGEYSFEVQARNEDGIWSEATKFSFEIQSPWWLRWWFFLLLAIAVAAAIFAFYKTRTGRLKKEIALQKQVTELERKALRAQMNPHFIFNCLTSIQKLILEKDADNAVRYLTRFSKLVRGALNASVAGEVSLQEEIDLLTNYLELEKLRFKDAFEYDIHADPFLDLFDTAFPPMLLQPFVENAVKHGMANKKEGGRIRILFHSAKTGGRVAATITDNGPGFASRTEKEDGHRSVGMSLTRRRLELLGEAQSGEQLKVEEIIGEDGQVEGTRVEVRF